MSIIPSLLISMKSKMSFIIENPGYGSLAYCESLLMNLLNWSKVIFPELSVLNSRNAFFGVNK